MRYRSRVRESASRVAFNFTPLIDVFFLLTIFFMLVAKFTASEQIPLQLPNPDESQAKATRSRERVVINCRLSEMSEAGTPVVAYSLGPNPTESLAGISDRIAAMKSTTPDLNVLIRADRRLAYEDVRAVMRVVSQNNVGMLQVAAIVGESTGEP